MIMRSLGLTNAKDTIVGDNSLRGVSGGERRRVTLGEMICGPQTVFLLDSVSTGLDSSTTFDIMNTLKVLYQQLLCSFCFVFPSVLSKFAWLAVCAVINFFHSKVPDNRSRSSS